jgi:hypothetical protein
MAPLGIKENTLYCRPTSRWRPRCLRPGPTAPRRPWCAPPTLRVVAVGWHVALERTVRGRATVCCIRKVVPEIVDARSGRSPRLLCARRRILAEEGLARLPGVHPVTVTTPCGPYAGLRAPSPDSLVVVSIVRAGEVAGGCMVSQGTRLYLHLEGPE